MRALRSILEIRWQDHITNLEVLDQAKSTSIEATIIKAPLRWVGHVIRMSECRMPRHLIYGQLLAGQNCGINTRSKPISSGTTSNRETWRDMPWNRPKWRGLVHKAAANFEEARCQKLTTARERHCRERHRRAASVVITTTDIQWPHCSRICTSRLGLQSHLRVHRWDAECKGHHWIRWTTAIYINWITMNRKSGKHFVQLSEH